MDEDPRLRQPIVAVLGHVDHGKTSLLDRIRSLSHAPSSVMDREAGGITQHIGATEISAEVLNGICAEFLGGRTFASPGLLFIDTPGHASFTALRKRGGALADIAILVVDLAEGLKPQTLESLRILKESRTPFVVAGNKLDRIHGWRPEPGRSFRASVASQRKEVVAAFDSKYYDLIGAFAEQGFNLERYDRISDFTKNIALVPCCAKAEHPEGLVDLLAITIGLAERFLEAQLTDIEGPAEATVLEAPTLEGLGRVLDVILHRGTLRARDRVLGLTANGIHRTRVKVMKRPAEAAQMRDAGDRWINIDAAQAAGGVRIALQEPADILPGTTLRVIPDDPELVIDVESAARSERDAMDEAFDLVEEGVVIRADSIGGLEALFHELKGHEIPVARASVGPADKRDVLFLGHLPQPEHRVALTLHVGMRPNAKEHLGAGDVGPVHHLEGDVIFQLVESYLTWREETLEEADRTSGHGRVFRPGKVLVLPDHVFHAKNPIVVGVRILEGELRVGQALITLEGETVGRVDSIQLKREEVDRATRGDEVAIRIPRASTSKGFDEGIVALADLPEAHYSVLRKRGIEPADQELVDDLLRIHRSEDHFWGRGRV